MRIEASQLSYVSAHRSASQTVAIDRVSGRTRNSLAGLRLSATDSVQLSSFAASSSAAEAASPNDSDAKNLAILLIEQLSGQKFKWFGSGQTGGSRSAPAALNSVSTGNTRQRIEIHSESEQTGFQAEGVVKTADGRSVRFSVKLDMQREFSSATVIADNRSTKDPLVVNFGGGPARLTGGTVSFDLNGDGNAENISFAAGGSGFLALDANGDGKVNDGSELFGPQSGNGFAELAKYDTDGNGWIDQNDPVYSKLRIWSQDGLSSLADNGIGAIAISSAETPFALKDNANRVQGDIRRTGVYLSENGGAGTVQQVDLAIES